MGKLDDLDFIGLLVGLFLASVLVPSYGTRVGLAFFGLHLIVWCGVRAYETVKTNLAALKRSENEQTKG